MNKPSLRLVVHHRDRETSFAQAQLAADAGADGVFLIAHSGGDAELPWLGAELVRAFPTLRVGVNLLSVDPLDAFALAVAARLHAVWWDHLEVSSSGLTLTGQRLADLVRASPDIEAFASVAFKYQAPDPDPPAAARIARTAGMIPTTSGPATGVAPKPAKIQDMSREAGGQLAIASGITPENAAGYLPWCSHLLVATGVSSDTHHFHRPSVDALIARLQRQGHDESSALTG